MDINENLNSLFEHLEKFFKTDTVIGKPITLGEITLVPIIDVGFGLGSGGGVGKDQKGNDGKGGGAGVGARITPSSILVIKGSEVSLLPLKGRHSLEKIVEMVPDILSKIKPDKTETPSTKDLEE